MALGPIEVLVVSFPGTEFNRGIVSELERLVDNGTIAVIDGVLVQKDALGEVTYTEFEEVADNEHAARLSDLIEKVDSLVSDEDVEHLAAGLEPGSSEAILVFEHTWAATLRDVVVGSGGVLAHNFRLPGAAVDELIAELAELDD